MLGIGISTYNDWKMTDDLLTSIIRITEMSHGIDYTILICDDCTQDMGNFKSLEDVCKKHGVRLVRNDTNKGIAGTWNRLIREVGPESTVVLNNDVLITHKDWLKCMDYFFNNNDKVGMVGWPLINPPDYHIGGGGRDGGGGDVTNISWDPNIEQINLRQQLGGDRPARVGSAVGCSFAIKKSVWEKVKNSDGSTGFWESTVSFEEEVHLGFKLWELGYRNYMIPYPFIIHIGSRTFAKNPRLIERVIDWNQMASELGVVGGNNLKDEYINTIMKSSVYPNSWKPSKIVWKNEKGEDMVDRMGFSRYMFAKKWGILSQYDNPAPPVHNEILRINERPPVQVKWLDREMKERVEMI